MKLTYNKYMRTIDRLNNYLRDNQFRITLYDNNKVDIINYDDIKDFDINKVIIKSQTKKIIIEGLNLTINKMLDDEVLIEGIISNIRIN